MAQPTQLWKTMSRSWDTPVKEAIVLALVGRMLAILLAYNRTKMIMENCETQTYTTNGRQARAIQPARVAIGGEPA